MAYRKVFARYNRMNIYFGGRSSRDTKYDNQTMDLWVKTFSIEVKRNLSPMYEFWGFYVSSKTKRYLRRKYTAFLPDDIITKQSPKRVGYIMKQYKNIQRTSTEMGKNGEVRKIVKRFLNTRLKSDVKYLKIITV